MYSISGKRGVKISAGAFLISVCMGLSSCAGASEPTSSPTPDTPPTGVGETAYNTELPEAVSPTMEAKIEPVAVSQEVGKGFTPLGHFLVDHSLSDYGNPWVSGPSEIYVVSHGLVNVSAQEIFPDREILRESYTSSGTSDQPLLAATVQYRVPAAGLEAQKWVTALASIDPASLEVLNEVEVSVVPEEPYEQPPFGSDSNIVAVAAMPPGSGSDPATVIGFDMTTGQKAWELPGYVGTGVVGAIVLTSDGTGRWSDGQWPCSLATGVDVSTGGKLYSVDFFDISPDWCEGVRMDRPEDGNYLYFWEAGNDPDYFSFNVVTGDKVTVPKMFDAADPRGSLVVGSNVKEPFEYGHIVVVDSLTGETKWELPADQVDRLDAEVQSLYNGKLYLNTTDQQPVIDVATGESIVDSSDRFPIGQVDAWTYWSDGTLDPTG